LTVLRTFPDVKVVGYAHRRATRQKAKELAVASEIVGDIKLSVSDADLVIVATPVHTFEKIFGAIAEALPKGCIVTDVSCLQVFGMSARIRLQARNKEALNSQEMICSKMQYVF